MAWFLPVPFHSRSLAPPRAGIRLCASPAFSPLLSLFVNPRTNPFWTFSIKYSLLASDSANHDLCDACYDTFKNEKKLLHVNGRRNPVSAKVSDLEFFVLAETGVFEPLVKAAGASQGMTKKSVKKVKPNSPCPCGSGKKYKKCCRSRI